MTDSMNIQDDFEMTEKIKTICFNARKAWFQLANLSNDQRNAIIRSFARQLEGDKEIIFAANRKDVEEALKNGLSEAMIDRLTINEKRFKDIITSLHQITELPDPLGIILDKIVRPNGLLISKISVPIGVIALIFESRPNVTIEAAALSIKSGNAMILRGGKEAYYTNGSLGFSIYEALKLNQLSENLVTLVPFKERSALSELLKQKDTVDLVIPRGGEGLINFVMEHSRIPVIKHYKGLCHTYIDKDADFKKAMEISINAKCQRPATCNAMETLLVHEEIAEGFLPELIAKFKEEGVLLKGCENTCKIDPGIEPATDMDWETEYLDKILSIKIVSSIEEAIDHIEKYGSRHSEAIITENKVTAAKFIQNIDASALFVNTSTRFNDGFEFGLGAELGISTDKLHARGPMGIREMTTYKYIVIGNGQIRK